MTGATGYIASQILPTFKKRYEMVLIDSTDISKTGNQIPSITIRDLMGSDRNLYIDLFAGVDTVVHLAYKRDRGTDLKDHFLPEMENIGMAYNVLRTSYEAGVRRVVVASSNHAADWYEHNLIHTRKMELLDPYKLPLSDNFYGWAKASYEHMGFLFASGNFGRQLEVVNIRIGAPREIQSQKYKDNPVEYKRDLGAYISKRDIAQLFSKAVDTPEINNIHGVPWQVIYGISNNTRAFWSLVNAREVLDYQPFDDSEIKYADEIRDFFSEETASPEGRVGIT
jgi:hypothetical protein